MAKVILFGGGDAGGIIIGPNGVRPIPPWDPAIRRQLRAISALLVAAQGVSQEEVRHQLGGLVSRLTNLAVSQVEGIAGPIDEEAGLVYQDDDGGFVCGSIGKPPIPFPWPAERMPGLEDLISLQLLNEDLVGFVNQAVGAGANLSELFREPSLEAERLGIQLPRNAETDLKALGMADPGSLEDPVDREILEFFHRAVEGEALEQWATRPYDVAGKIGVDLSPEAADRIISASAVHLGGRDPGSLMSPYAVAVVVVVVIVVWTRERRVPVLDRSNVRKF